MRISIWRILFYIILFFVVLWLLLWIIVYTKYIKDLPKIEELENLDIAQSSTIYDRDWNVLYNIYKEKRTYIEYDRIWKNMINALISW
jgi:membrane carboxypeptidase/penicillin-binding protein